MNRALAVCFPPTDVKFGEWVRGLIADDPWDLGSPEGIALMQAVLRTTYPQSMVKHGARTLDGGAHPTVVVEVYRDQSIGRSVERAAALYDRIGAAAYRTALSIVGDGAQAERVVEASFHEVLGAIAVLSTELETASLVSATRRRAFESRNDERHELPAGQTDLSTLSSAERVALELAAVEGLKIAAIADRMQLSMASVHRLLGEGLASLRTGTELGPGLRLEQWRDAQRGWERMQDGDPARVGQAAMVGHAFVAYLEAAGSIPDGHAVLVTDRARRYLAVSAGAAALMGRRTLVGLLVDDVTPEATRAMVPDIWAQFLADGSMAGEYAVDRPGQASVSLAFRAETDHPLPGLQVSHLEPSATMIESRFDLTIEPLETDEASVRPAIRRALIRATG